MNKEVTVTFIFNAASEENGLVTDDQVPPVNSSKVTALIGHLVASVVVATFAEARIKVSVLVPEK